MRFRILGHTDINVSLICLGSMTWGEQNSRKNAFEQLDFSLDYGVNFIDTAEMYAVPPRQETYGLTEQYIGDWFKHSGKRDQVILATKVMGRAARFPYARPHLHNGETRLDKQSIFEACDASLKRLQTDYIDLYQLHWPDRQVNLFGQLGYSYNPDDDPVPLLESLEALNELVTAGKVRYIGLSNESPWGTMEFLRLAEKHDLPRVVSIQNPYNLLNRAYDFGMSEISCLEKVGLLAYSPLAMGVLSGKYQNNARPQGSRMQLFGHYFTKYIADDIMAVVDQYVAIARKHGLDPSTMAHAFVNQQPFTTSNIIGATNLDQIKTAIESVETILSEEILNEIAEIHGKYPHPLSM